MSGSCGNGNRCGEGALTWVTLIHAGSGTLGHMGGGNRCGVWSVTAPHAG